MSGWWHYAVLFVVVLLPFLSSTVLGRAKRRSPRWMRRDEDVRRYLAAIPGAILAIGLVVVLSLIDPSWL